MESKQEELLCRVIANHLYLSQFEPFRACIHTLYDINPALALGILQAIIQKGGELKGIIWSEAVPSPAHLTWLCLGELLSLEGERKFSFRGERARWASDPQLIFNNVEFLLLVELLKRLSASKASTLTEESADKLWELGRYDFRKFGESSSISSSSSSGNPRKSEGITFDGFQVEAKRQQSTDGRRQGVEASSSEGTLHGDGETSRTGDSRVPTGSASETAPVSDKTKSEDGQGDSVNIQFSGKKLEEAGGKLMQELSDTGLERLIERFRNLDAVVDQEDIGEEVVFGPAQLDDGEQRRDGTEGGTARKIAGPEAESVSRDKSREQSDTKSKGASSSAHMQPRPTILEQDSESKVDSGLAEEYSAWVKKLTLYHPDLLHALSSNIRRQQHSDLPNPKTGRKRNIPPNGDDPSETDPGIQVDDSGPSERVDESSSVTAEQGTFKLGDNLGTEVQNAHLLQIKEDVRGGRLVRASQHIRYLHIECGIAESQYRDVMRLIMKAAKKSMDPGRSPRDRVNDASVLWIYEQVNAACSAKLLRQAECAQDDLILEEVEENRTGAGNILPPPLERLHKQLQRPRPVISTSIVSTDASSIRTCKVDMFQYARVVGEHVLEAVMEASFNSIKVLQIQKAADVLAPFPRLQPLVTVMGWDLLGGNTSGRRRLVELLWNSRQKSGRLDGGSIPGRPAEEESCIEELCHQLCYRLELAYFAALVNSGVSWETGGGKIFGNTRSKSIGRNQEEQPPADPFVANLVLERLAMHSAIRVIFDVVPDIKLQDAIQLVEMQPIGSSTTASWQRQQDLELLHMHFGVQAAVHTLVSMEASAVEAQRAQAHRRAKYFLLELRQHLEAVTTPIRKHWMLSMVVHLLHMDELSLSVGANEGLAQWDDSDTVKDSVGTSKLSMEEEKSTAVAFVGDILGILRQAMSSAVFEAQGKRKQKQSTTYLAREVGSANTALPDSARKPWQQKMVLLQKFVDDWEWRLAVLQRLSPTSQRQWQWKEALAVLRAAPSTLLNMCVQRAQFDLGEEAVHRFALPPEEAASLQLAEYIDRAVARTSVDDPVSHVDERSPPEKKLEDLRPLASVLLCLDVAAASASKVYRAKPLLEWARVFLSQMSQGVNQKQSSTLMEQKQEACLVFVVKRVLQRLQDLLEQDRYRPLQASLSGADMVSSGPEVVRQGPRQRALGILQQTIEDAHDGKRQFLSGTLHNLGKALANEDVDDNSTKQVSSPSEKKQMSMEHVLGCGYVVSPKNAPVPSSGLVDHAEFSSLAVKPAEKLFLGPLGNKRTAYLSAFILYIATVGDIVDGVDTTHDYNFFSLVYERPNDLLTRLVFERGSADAAGKVAGIMKSDLVQQIITACVPPVYPPKGGKGWACIPRLPARVVQTAGVIQSSTTFPTAPGENDAELYPLQRDVIKHLATLSPVRAILACVFGSSRFTMFVKEGDGDHLTVQEQSQKQDADRWFYEFALEQSDRYSTLNRWIQLQANLQRLSESPISTKRLNDAETQKEEDRRKSTKRLREPEQDVDSEDEQEKIAIIGMQGPPAGWEGLQRSTIEKSPLGAVDVKASQTTAPFTVLLDWENEGPYEEAVQGLMEEGKLVDALALADRWLRDGAPDRLLQLLIERGEDGGSHSSLAWQGHGSSHHNLWNSSWQYCIRLRDKNLAATLALKYLHRWELDAAIDVLTMCSCHLDPKESLYEEAVRVKQSLQQYGRILRADSRFSNWREVEAFCQSDPEGLALRLASKGAVSAALDVAESFNLPNVTRRELQGRQLVKLLTSDPTTGGGPAEGLRFLSSLNHPEDALAVAMTAMEQLPNLRSKQLLVHFFLKRRVGTLSEAEHGRLDQLALGLRMLGALPLPWQQRCSALHEHPRLILETLLMWKQLKAASQLLDAFPKLRDNGLIISYAAKAISFSTVLPVERRTYSPSANNKPLNRMKTNISSGISILQRRAFSWASRDAPAKVVAKEPPNRKRKGSMLPPSQIAAWEAMAGIPEERPSAGAAAPQEERLAPVTMGDEWVLTGDPAKDDVVRNSHRYESAPSSILFKALLSLCSEEIIAAKAAVDLCDEQVKKLLCAEQLPLKASSEVKERAFHATEAFVQALLHARAQLRNLAGQSQKMPAGPVVGTDSEKKDSAEDVAGQSSSISPVAPLTDELPKLLIRADVLLSRVELLQSLLGAGVSASINDLEDEGSDKLRDRLIKDERYTMAVHTCTKCKIDALPVWQAWGHALLRMERYPQARAKFSQALRLLKGDKVPFIRQIINTVEGGPPVDVEAAISMYAHVAQNISSVSDDSLSADAYLSVLYIPSFTKADRSRRTSEESADRQQESAVKDSLHRNGDEPLQSNLDSVRYNECVYYLQEHARSDLLSFAFRHGRYYEACQLFFPADSVPPPPLPSPYATQAAASSSPQRTDPLATDYGSVDDLLDRCVAYGVVPVLERALAIRVDSTDAAVREHTSLALTRICSYCEAHRNFNHLYRFQLLKKDYVAAGLCCIQLFLNSQHQDEAVRQLECARGHFDEGLAVRQQSGDLSKGGTKVARGKLPSDKLTDEELLKFTARIRIQLEVVRAFSENEGPLWKWSLFGNPNDADTFKRRSDIAEAIVEKNFDLAFQVIYDFQLPAVHIYAGVAASLAERKKSGILSDLLKKVKGTIPDDDFDQVLGAAINVLAKKKERPDKLIDQLSSNHRKVLACVICGRLKSAYQIASRSNSVSDVQYVSHQAGKSKNLAVLDLCQQWLAKNS
ncbi:zinc finger FYVE domain-containing protein 26 [Marchantia polymorpha subsp. ruderalis]|uniref:ZFYVE26-like TPR repeats domain-containing protein n=2 Tax=Marchantia polymorpha TaxID=3197 RepID=A0AAF6B2P0_MARPO|nr:hypothetical protein MARPO_0049s0060 [Marchantia polymorpha]BBN06274.1 hypothetical protein Mp_3g19740 [Marchantia polymorpha subsp. ruderalis]|eukprot:PTQ38769.1 hypothetical protein MARPO_0049s0060 [Marchantia polymorpha]